MAVPGIGSVWFSELRLSSAESRTTVGDRLIWPGGFNVTTQISGLRSETKNQDVYWKPHTGRTFLLFLVARPTGSVHLSGPCAPNGKSERGESESGSPKLSNALPEVNQ